MAVKIRNGQTVVFIGDSITDCGRRVELAPLGGGYVKFFADMLTIREPSKDVTIINKGIGGDTVLGLRDRWQDDVLRHKPDWLSVKIGINDLHRVLRDAPEGLIPPELYREAYNDILARTREALPKCRMLLIDPFYISNEASVMSFRQQVLGFIPEYVRVVGEISRKYGALRVKTHEMFQKLLKHHEVDTFCPEPVHPNATGHLAIAEAVYSALS